MVLALVVLAVIVAGCTAARPHRAARAAAVYPGMSVDWALSGRATSPGTHGPGGSPALGSTSAARHESGDAGPGCPGSGTGGRCASEHWAPAWASRCDQAPGARPAAGLRPGRRG